MKEIVLKKKPKKITEASVTTALLSQLRKENKKSFFYKISDTWKNSKPFDIIWVKEWWQWFAWEIKLIKTKSINYWVIKKWLEPHQALRLSFIIKAWWEAKIIWYHVDTNTFYFYDYIL